MGLKIRLGGCGMKHAAVTTMTQGLNRAQSSEQKRKQNRNNDQWAVRDRLELRITHLSDVCIE